MRHQQFVSEAILPVISDKLSVHFRSERNEWIQIADVPRRLCWQDPLEGKSGVLTLDGEGVGFVLTRYRKDIFAALFEKEGLEDYPLVLSQLAHFWAEQKTNAITEELVRQFVVSSVRLLLQLDQTVS